MNFLIILYHLPKTTEESGPQKKKKKGEKKRRYFGGQAVICILVQIALSPHVFSLCFAQLGYLMQARASRYNIVTK